MSDHDLLRQYARDGSQAAFAELVDRHLNLVYSAARRQVCSQQLAEDIAQSVFVELARQSGGFKSDTPLVAWLHVVTRRTAIDFIRRETRRIAREEQAADLMKNDSAPVAWSAVEPLLDEAVESLAEPDRTAILLRYFQNKSLRDVGAALGTSDDAAQKRVSRAVEQLREFFLRRGIAVSAAGLTADLSAHALHFAPGGLGLTITSAVSLSGAANSVATFEATKAIAMTTVQKVAFGTAFALVLGTGLYEATLFASQRSNLAALQRDTADLAAQLRRATQQAAATTHQLDAARQEQSAAQADKSAAADPATAEIRAWLERVDQLKRYARDSGKSIPEIALLSDQEWLDATQHGGRNANSDPRQEIDNTLRSLRGRAKMRFAMILGLASRAYVKAHDGQLPNDTRELWPYFEDNNNFKASDVDEAMLTRYAIRYTGALADVPPAERSAVFIEITSPDEEHDQRAISGPGGGRIRDFRNLSEDISAALWAFGKANAGATPTNPADLLPYFRPPLSAARQDKFMQTFTPPAPR